MTLVPVNYIAVLVTAIVGFAIGAAWYSPILFGKQWAALMGMRLDDPAVKKNANRAMAIGFVGQLVTAFVLAQFVSHLRLNTIGEAILMAFWIWLGFVATVLLGSILWENKPPKLFAINAAYNLVVLAVMASVLTLWG